MQAAVRVRLGDQCGARLYVHACMCAPLAAPARPRSPHVTLRPPRSLLVHHALSRAANATIADMLHLALTVRYLAPSDAPMLSIAGPPAASNLPLYLFQKARTRACQRLTLMNTDLHATAGFEQLAGCNTDSADTVSDNSVRALTLLGGSQSC